MVVGAATSWHGFAVRPGRKALVDAAIAVSALAVSLALLSHGGLGSPLSEPRAGELDGVSWVLAACTTLPLLAWRRSPRLVFALTASAMVPLAALGYSIGLPPGPTVALYLYAGSRDDRDPWTHRDTGTALALFLAYLGATAWSERGFPTSELLHTGLAWAVAWFAGERTRLRREKLSELEERAHRAEREAEQERMLAAAEERARIARDLHDSAGHAISTIAVRAGAARLRHGDDPDRSLAALEVIEEMARQTAEEIDRIVGTLRQDSTSNGVVEAPLGLASVTSLIAQHSGTGLDVTLQVVGDPRPLDSVTDQAAYRLLQEALTNAHRHGAGTAEVMLVYREANVELTVTNPVATGAAARPGGGHGLIGMRERATLLGGDLDATRANGEFRIHARIPSGGPIA